MTIKFKYPFSKLFYNNSPLDSARLLQVIETDFSDLSQEFKDYDTDFGKFQLPIKGACVILIFSKPGGIFTTVRSAVPDKVEAYKKAVGQLIKIDLWHDVKPEMI